MRKKILVLDDDNDILEILTMLLDSDYEIKTLSCGDTVFDDIKEFQPDLILMDVLLADMDGRAICKDIKDNHLTSFIPVILISGHMTLPCHFICQVPQTDLFPNRLILIICLKL